MSWFTNIFGGTEVAADIAKTAADGIYNGLDKLVYTEEEKADSELKGKELWFKIVELGYKENGPRSVNRRWLAWGITAWILINAQFCVLFAVLGWNSVVDKIIEVAVAFQLGWAFVAVVSFFFLVQFPRAMKK